MDHWSRSWFRSITFLLFSFSIHFSEAADTLSPAQSLSGNQTIVSQGGIFVLGFFTPGNSQNFYIGIWYKKDPQKNVAWVANRDKPIPNTGISELRLSQDGNLVLTHSQIQIWSSNITRPTSSPIVAVLLDTGNFVLTNGSNSTTTLWQSFDHPTHTWLPTQKIGLNRVTGENQLIVSWRNLEDPASGLFARGIDPNGTNQFFLWRKDTLYWTSGLWDGKVFANIPSTASRSYLHYVHVSNERGNYFSYTFRDPSVTAMVVMDVTGQTKILIWLERSQAWQWICLLPSDPCSIHSLCGAFGSCSRETIPLCDCLEGFEPRYEKDWNLSDWSGGCVRRTPLQCYNEISNGTEKDEFLMISNVRLPNPSQCLAVRSVEDCQSACLSTCSCDAYSYNGSCLIWIGSLYDLKTFTDSSNGGRDSEVLYLRLAASNLPTNTKKKRKVTGIVIDSVAGFIAILGISGAVVWGYQRRQFRRATKGAAGPLVVFTFKDLLRATNNFSEKVGEGSFGSVFRGALPDIGEIAVKRVGGIGGSEKQFRAEVSTIGMIQHVNLVNFRGFCSQGTERLLVYDYMLNGSLASHLFGNNLKVLQWTTRYKIALGTARALTYLHEKCRDCIIHCDIKPENILLDSEFSPKVADFGLAKLVGRDITGVLTTVRGTLGYLAPEWICGMAITSKVDVYSYGMMLFELISGRRNTVQDENISFFPMFAAKKINEDDVLCLLDRKLDGNAYEDELRRACRVALWCIQDDERHRPSMSLVVQILEEVSEVNIPPIPRWIRNLDVALDDFLT